MLVPRVHRFGPFGIDEGTGLLLKGDRSLALGRPAVALLRALIAHPGLPLSKDELVAAAWPGRAMQDSNLTVQVAALRRALALAPGGAAWIETLPRRGYRYVGPPIEPAGPVAQRPRHPSASPDASASPARVAVSDRPSVAVLPLVDLSDEPGQRYFVDGMTEEIVAGLSRVKGLFVIAASSSFSLPDAGGDAVAAGRRLGVRYLVEGSVRRYGQRIRVLARLIAAETGEHLWSERFDRAHGRLFALQDEIALSVVGAIEPGLRRAEAQRVARSRPDSLDAYDLVLRSQADVDSGMPERIARALPLLERALQQDPTHAAAHAQLAMCHHCLYLRGTLDAAHRRASIAHAEAAIEHGQDDARALSFAGFSLGMDGHDPAAAFVAFDAALAISPSSAITCLLGSVIDGWTGNAPRALDWAQRGLRLSPFDSWRFAALHAVALAQIQSGRHDEAVDAAQRAVQANPAHSISYMLLAAALAGQGRLSEGRAAAAQLLQRQPDFRCSRQFRGVNCAPALAAALSGLLMAVGLPR